MIVFDIPLVTYRYMDTLSLELVANTYSHQHHQEVPLSRSQDDILLGSHGR